MDGPTEKRGSESVSYPDLPSHSLPGPAHSDALPKEQVQQEDLQQLPQKAPQQAQNKAGQGQQQAEQVRDRMDSVVGQEPSNAPQSSVARQFRYELPVSDVREEIIRNAKIVLRILNPESHAADKQKQYQLVPMFVQRGKQREQWGWRFGVVSDGLLVVQGKAYRNGLYALHALHAETCLQLEKRVTRPWVQGEVDENEQTHDMDKACWVTEHPKPEDK